MFCQSRGSLSVEEKTASGARPLWANVSFSSSETSSSSAYAARPDIRPTSAHQIGRERGWPPTTKERFVAEIEEGALYVGSPETVAQKIARNATALGIGHFDLKYATGPVPHADLMTCIRLYGEQVIPRVREILDAGA